LPPSCRAVAIAGRYYDDRWDHAYTAGECRIIRSRTVLPDGRVIFRKKRVCY